MRKTIASIWDENMVGYLFLDICYSKLTLTVCVSEQITYADKYPSIFPPQMEAIVYVFHCTRDIVVR